MSKHYKQGASKQCVSRHDVDWANITNVEWAKISSVVWVNVSNV